MIYLGPNIWLILGVILAITQNHAIECLAGGAAAASAGISHVMSTSGMGTRQSLARGDIKLAQTVSVKSNQGASRSGSRGATFGHALNQEAARGRRLEISASQSSEGMAQSSASSSALMAAAIAASQNAKQHNSDQTKADGQNKASEQCYRDLLGSISQLLKKLRRLSSLNNAIRDQEGANLAQQSGQATDQSMDSYLSNELRGLDNLAVEEFCDPMDNWSGQANEPEENLWDSVYLSLKKLRSRLTEMLKELVEELKNSAQDWANEIEVALNETATEKDNDEGDQERLMTENKIEQTLQRVKGIIMKHANEALLQTYTNTVKPLAIGAMAKPLRSLAGPLAHLTPAFDLLGKFGLDHQLPKFVQFFRNKEFVDALKILNKMQAQSLVDCKPKEDKEDLGKDPNQC